jgi:hypothetical protein
MRSRTTTYNSLSPEPPTRISRSAQPVSIIHMLVVDESLLLIDVFIFREDILVMRLPLTRPTYKILSRTSRLIIDEK